jgi:hypothetical protein
METKTETLDSPNEELETSDSEKENEPSEAHAEDSSELLQAKNKQLYERAKKAEAEAKELREFKLKAENKTDPDMGELAYFNSKGIEIPEDIEYIKKEAKDTGKSVPEIMKFNYVKETLQLNKQQREAKAGMPHGSERTGGGGVNSIEYHLAKGTPDDQELAEKVVQARIGKETTDKFGPIPE